MNTKQLPTDFPDVQAAIYRVALSLDAFLLNGIMYGVIRRDVFNGFLEKTAGNLLAELASLEQQVSQAPVTSQPEVTAILASLRTRCQQLIDLATGLTSFRTLPLEEVRPTVSQIPVIHEACVRQIQELEACFRTPRPFYQSRPPHSAAAVTDFLANLERVFTEEWTAACPR
jgi:hypothetical protein